MLSFHLQEMINEIDQDGNGCISFNEFVYLMTKNVHEVIAQRTTYLLTKLCFQLFPFTVLEQPHTVQGGAGGLAVGWVDLDLECSTILLGQ